MKDLEKQTLIGTFTVQGREVAGKIRLAGPNSCLEVWGKELLDVCTGESNESVKFVLGVLNDQNRVSLIDCVEMGSSFLEGPPGAAYLVQGETVRHIRFFPGYMILGHDHISHEEKAIDGVSFVMGDANSLFHDHQVLGLVTSSKDARPLVEQIVQSGNPARKIEVGEYPVILYYTGKSQIFDSDTVLGNISGRRVARYDIARYQVPSGAKIENQVFVNLRFAAAVTFHDAIQRALEVLRFFELLAGRPQNLEDLSVRKQGSSRGLQVYGSWFPRHERSENEQIRRLLVDAVNDPKQFSDLLRNWLERRTWRSARGRFFDCFGKELYDMDRLIGVASAFEFLPDCAGFDKNNPGKNIDSLHSEVKKMGVEKGGVIKSKLGRIINSRAQLIINEIGDKVPELPTVIKWAVDCRNEYVHGQSYGIDYGRKTEAVIFLTDTLEFIFAASDLIESGWDIKARYKSILNGPHPFDYYLAHYKVNLQKSKHLLVKQ